jgi:hypothetical protein
VNLTPYLVGIALMVAVLFLAAAVCAWLDHRAEGEFDQPLPVAQSADIPHPPP